jgi:hypothetical protein
LRFCEDYPNIFELKDENGAIKWNIKGNTKKNKRIFRHVRVFLLVSVGNKNSFSIADTNTALSYTSLSTDDATDVTLASSCVDPCTSVAAAASTNPSSIQPPEYCCLVLSPMESAAYAAYIEGFMFRMFPHSYADGALPCYLVVEAMNRSHDIYVKFIIQKLAK